MNTIHDEIKALKPWPKLKSAATSAPYRTWYDYEHRRCNAALARLALVCKVLPNVIEYLEADSSDSPDELIVDLRALLAALEPPK